MMRTFLVNPRLRDDQTEKAKEEFQNLVKQLPAEATGIYLAGISFFKDDVLWLSIAAVIGLLILIWVRARANVSSTIWLASIIGYIVWIYALGNGPFQAVLAALRLNPPALLGAFLVTVYSTIVTVLAFNPPKNG